ncbi:aminotransferase class I/II-fold pyridoxal phosphate-dependent enzyme [Conexibacter sp. W3-3-2]|uniref:aminotransferase class I/II-fold pyridoxal phosphate-dependent enzyme n=1 Tax=Conexibacter sp. W3-3-2 TaxID=2675227 RepID=UPI0012B86698|nr:aminotransferase class I/II-fold pyridoxal phosphate-dependent enzyme [Conexibacter sp. W3-3-2]MTD44112.1 aminotransferase class I/II-fold pyridoxal phosphate-dependent enzyme [Conexibacter sp. W3-3-2]
MLHGEDQPRAPYLDAVVGYGFRGPGRFHVPGHKGGPGADPGLRHAIGDDALALDVPQDIHGIDLGSSPTPYEQAERLAADAYGAQRSFFLTNGATQGNHALALALAPLGAKVVAQRNSHASLVDGLVLSGGLPSFVAPEVESELGMAHGVDPQRLDEALTRAGEGVTAAFVVSPTYYGMCADVAALARVAHAHGVPLVVDQSWGPHFGFHPDVPQSALHLDADAVLTSTHKIVGALTQSAILHVADTGRIDAQAVARTLRLLRSTSPSSLLMASLDAARRQLAMHGEALLHETLAAIGRTREKLGTVPGLRVIGADFVGTPGVADWDPLRIVVDVRGTGATGHRVADALRRAYDVNVELATNATFVLLVGMAETPTALERVAGDIDEIVKVVSVEGTGEALVAPPAVVENEMVVPPREAFLGRAERVPVDDAVGRVSCESIAGYPPGIPALLPGERITAETVAYLRALAASGSRLHGASDPAFAHVHVLAAD